MGWNNISIKVIYSDIPKRCNTVQYNWKQWPDKVLIKKATLWCFSCSNCFLPQGAASLLGLHDSQWFLLTSYEPREYRTWIIWLSLAHKRMPQRQVILCIMLFKILELPTIMNNQEEKRSMTTCDLTEEEIKHTRKKNKKTTYVYKCCIPKWVQRTSVCCKINLQINILIKFIINFSLISCTRSPRVTNKMNSVGLF